MRVPRYLYWSDWGENPHIGRVGMDGTNRSVVVEDRITWPNGLTLDLINDRIYWADAREDYIQFASMDGSNRHTGRTHSAGGLGVCVCVSLCRCVFVCAFVCVYVRVHLCVRTFHLLIY